LHKNCFLKHVTEAKIEGTGIRGTKLKQILDDLKVKKKGARS